MNPDTQFDLGPPGPVLGVRAYRLGRWNGVETTPEELAELVANFALFALPQGTESPFYVPFDSINHSDLLAFGRVTAARLDGEYLTLDLDGVPLSIRRWMRSRKLTYPSVEVWLPGEFSGPDGTQWPTHVLRCVTFLGADAPGVKGLPMLCEAVFPGLEGEDPATGDIVPASLMGSLLATREPLKQYRDYAVSIRKFSDLPPSSRGKRFMDRTAIIKALADAGVPAAGLEQLPDETLKAMSDVAAKASKANNDDDEDDKKKDKEDAKTKEFRDRAKKAATEAEGLVVILKAQADAATANAKQLQDRARAERVKMFRDEMTGGSGRPAFMTPAQFDAVEPMLLMVDHTAVKKFADGKTDGTALDEQIARIKAANPNPIKKFGHQVADGSGGNNPPPQAAGHNYTVPPARSELSPEAARMLDSTPEGRAAFARLR